MKWLNIFEYVNGVLYWKNPTGRRVHKGDIAGKLTKGGYIRISINGRCVYRHIIVWEIHNGNVPVGFEVDHINDIAGDDRIENLQILKSVDNKEKMCLSKNLNSRNKSGIKGVCFSQKRNKWVATIKGKQIGRFESFDEAVKARRNAEIALFAKK
ncbi:HNH endonuclease [Salmonella enterica]|nr:HNH endonuclease [Salmonella enterica]